MGLKAKLPGMREESGHRVRNVLFGIGYAFLVLMVIGSLGDGGDSGAGEPEIDGAAEAEAAEGDAAQADESKESNAKSDGADKSSEATESDAATDSSEKASDDASNDKSSETATDGGETAAAQAAESESQAESTSQSQGLTPADMETLLTNEFGLDIYVMDVGDGTVEADYFSYAGGDSQQLAEEIGMIAGSYSALVGDGYETDEMVINVKAPNAEAIGEFRIDAADAQAHADGEISDNEYAQIVLDSGEVYD